jgi:hypothetical protein
MSLRRSNILFNNESFLQNIDKLGSGEKNTFSRQNSKSNYETLNEKTTATISMQYKKPEYKGIKKEFISNEKKPLRIKDGTNITDILDINQIQKIDNGVQEINFRKFLNHFKNESELKGLKINELLNIDFEELKNLKKKTINFIEYCKIAYKEYLMDPNPDDKDEVTNVTEEEVVEFFKEKLEELRTNEINLHLVIDNIEKITEIVYSKDSIKIKFDLNDNENNYNYNTNTNDK